MKFTVLGPPRTKKNHQRIVRVKGRPIIVQSNTASEWEKAAVLQLQAGMQRYRGVTFHEGQRWNLRALVYREKNIGDLGNYLAAVCDALERAGVVENDRYIAGFDGSRLLVDKVNPRVEIELAEMEVTGV